MSDNVAFVYGRTDVELKPTSSTTTVANNPVAKLMFYLSCVSGTIDLSQFHGFERFTKYAQYWQLSVSEQKDLVAICEVLNPSVLVGCVFFPTESSNCENEFYELSVARTQLAVVARASSTETGAALIGGRNVLVRKIMTFTQSWLTIYYTTPLSELKSMLLRPNRIPFSSSVHPAATPHYDLDDIGCCEKKSLLTFGVLMILFALADLVATSINLARGGADAIGAGIWAGFLWGIICGSVMIRAKSDNRKRRILTGLIALLLHGFQFIYVIINSGPVLLLLPVNYVEVYIAAVLALLDLLAVLMTMFSACCG